VTIHSDHPFAEPEDRRDPARRFRGRLGAAVTLWTAGEDRDRAGLTISSVMVAHGPTPRVLALVDPDSDLYAELADTRRAVVQLLSWSHRDLAEAFAGTAPAPGGPWRLAAFDDTRWGPRLADASSWAGVLLESDVEVGWSRLLTCVIESVTVGDDPEPLISRRGRWVRP
jgi:flavin reductase (DIM6/NTAB) family NADH-FMN oxidoreductase RutF